MRKVGKCDVTKEGHEAQMGCQVMFSGGNLRSFSKPNNLWM